MIEGKANKQSLHVLFQVSGLVLSRHARTGAEDKAAGRASSKPQAGQIG